MNTFLQFLLFFIHLFFLFESFESKPTIVCDGTVILPYCDKSIHYKERAEDLVLRMTLEEKVQQIGDVANGVPRLNIPKYNWWSEALHGVSDVGRGVHFDDMTPAATNFPSVILTGASFNETLWRKLGEAISDEARALHNVGLAGLTYWSPTINVARDPRWGRIMEVVGEDSYVIGRYAVNYVRGLQDVKDFIDVSNPNERPLKVGACCKHYTASDLDNWKEIDRFHFDAKVSKRDLAETFNYPFEMCVKEGDVASVMCSYNEVNGYPACADRTLLKHTIRDLWELHGYIVADCDSVRVMQENHKFRNYTPEEAVGQAFQAGLDLDCGKFYTEHATEAVYQGKLHQNDIDVALINLYVVWMRLGLFDGSPGQFDELDRDDVCKPNHLELAVEAARQGIVLLKNDNDTLPLSFNDRKPEIAVVGPHANATVAMIGNYALKTGVACRYQVPFQVIGQRMGNVKYAPGCYDIKCSSVAGIVDAVDASKGADITIIFVGLDLSVEAEGLDRDDLYLPGNQGVLINSVVKASTGSVVLIIFSAGGVDISNWRDDPKVHSIVWAGYPGAEGGEAIVDVLLGNHNPAGRLPITWYSGEYIDNLPMSSMSLRPVPELKYPGRTYKFYNGSVVYSFGYGLSYTTFSYSFRYAPTLVLVKIRKSSKEDQVVPIADCVCGETLMIVVDVTNLGNRDGAHTLILYTSAPSSVDDAPLKKVVGFSKAFVRRNETVKVEFNLSICGSFNYFDREANELLPAGDHLLTIGNTKPDGNADDPISAKIVLKFDGHSNSGRGSDCCQQAGWLILIVYFYFQLYY